MVGVLKADTVWTQLSAHEELLKPVAPGKGAWLDSGKGDWDVMEFKCPFMGQLGV